MWNLSDRAEIFSKWDCVWMYICSNPQITGLHSYLFCPSCFFKLLWFPWITLINYVYLDIWERKCQHLPDPSKKKEGNNKQTVLESSDLPRTSPTADLRFPKMRTDHGNFPAMMDHRRNVTFNGLVIPLETFYPVRNHTGTLRNIISKMFGERCLFQILFWGEPSQRIISFQGYPWLYTIHRVVCLIKPS